MTKLYPESEFIHFSSVSCFYFLLFRKVYWQPAICMCRVHKRFREVSPDLVPKSMTGTEPVTVKVPLEKMEKLPELRVCYSSNRNVMINCQREKFTSLLFYIIINYKIL